MKRQYHEPTVQTVKRGEKDDILLKGDVDIDVGGLYGSSL